MKKPIDGISRNGFHYATGKCGAPIAMDSGEE
jgi:hypothetical protein